GTFKNPILFADYSDPDVIRVGDTYYMTASSFNYTPGLPVLISKDLVNWKLVNYALTNIDYDKYKIPQHSKGVWAPAIRYHEGRFYIYYGMPDEGFFMVSTENPLGKWDEPVLVLEGKGLIDSCPFWDDDGRAYLVHGYAKSRIGFKSYLGIFEMTPDGKKAITEDHLLYNGVETQPTIEGPKVYKRSGYYYIFAPAGGVKTGWQTVLRSKNIYGPYEEKIVMRQGNSIINGPHQGGLVDTVNGDEWFIHFQDKGLYGRITHLQPVVWENDWPIIGINAVDGCGEPCIIHKKPNTGVEATPASLEASDDFYDNKLKLLWQWLGNWEESFYSLVENPGHLRLYALNPAGKENAVLWEEANVLTQKLVCPYFTAVSCIHFGGLLEGEQAGMVMMGGHYAYIAVRVVNGNKKLVFGRAYDGDKGSVREEIKELAVLSDITEKIDISFAMTKGKEGSGFEMFYSVNDEETVKVDTDFMPSDHTWVGSKIGLFANSSKVNSKGGYADFEYIHVKALEG
ncbi:MAG: glycoside hydrolase 43 family protein, partial [Suilimivivens sp.]